MSILRPSFLTAALALAFFLVDTGNANARQQTAPPEAWARSLEQIRATNARNLGRLFARSDRIIGLELIIADGTSDHLYSRWGHAMLRFVGSGQDPLNDSVLSLVAEVNEPSLDIGKGLFGGYPVVPLVKSFREFWLEYVRGEFRPLSRFVIPTTPELRQRLLEILQEWVRHPQEAGQYTFFGNNCAGALAKLLEKSGFPGIFPRPAVPTSMNDWLAWSWISPYGELRMENFSSVFQKVAELLNLPQSDLLLARHRPGLIWPSDSAALLEQNLSDLETAQVLHELLFLPEEVRARLQARIDARKGDPALSLARMIGLVAVPAEFYRLCEDLRCTTLLFDQEEEVFGVASARDAWRVRDFVYAQAMAYSRGPEAWRDIDFREDISLMPTAIRENPLMFRHYQLLLRAGARP